MVGRDKMERMREGKGKTCLSLLGKFKRAKKEVERERDSQAEAN